MCGRYLGFVLLVWIPQVLNALSAVQSCAVPILNGGYFVRELSDNPTETKLTYACDNGRKPAVEGWWATSICQNDKWSPALQCIEEKACVPLTIPNGNYDASTDGWYQDTDKIRVRCDKGYEHKNNKATAQCINGTWSSVPICERSADSCGDPPKIPHAVIIGNGYQEVSAESSQLQYKCEDGYAAEGAVSKTISCISGNWTEGPTCSGGHTTVRKPVSEVETCGTPPLVANGDVVNNNKRYLQYQCAAQYQLVGPKMVGCYSDGTWSEAPTCKATYCSVDTDELSHIKSVGVRTINDGEEENLECSSSVFYFSEAQCTRGKVTFSECVGNTMTKPVSRVEICGTPPVVADGDVVKKTGMSLRYQCAAQYELVGPKMVGCYSDGTWSKAPTCKATYCSVDTYELDHVKSVGVRLINDGEEENFECSRHGRFFDHFSEAQCTRGKVTFSECCNWAKLHTVFCKDLLLVGM
ncbi:complement factor H-like isoform X2 [Gymnodraco acuticeps]|uniref:Complement factor H-like isoform X2 n=1 Tax=Gymnodraco acuticeps TaxID=8218 RepID=A0A6P8SZR1_GYMAC|nr:complement factor H-like isoform X2 [Gymnodraco acuticeps]